MYLSLLRAAALSTAVLLLAASPARPQERPPRAAVLPASGILDREELKVVTSECRRALRASGYWLFKQSDVRRAAEGIWPEGASPTDILEPLVRTLGADLSLAPSVLADSDGSLRLVAVAQPVGEPSRSCVSRSLIRPDRAGRLDRAQLRSAVAGCVRRLAEPSVPGTAPSDSEAVEGPEEGDTGTSGGHSGLFVELGFDVAWCLGDTMCSGSGAGYGGRLGIGYRIRSYAALYISAILAGQDIPTTTDIEELVRIRHAFLWFGIFAGARFHPVESHWLDPFLGLDLGWARLYYTERRTEENPDDLPEDVPDRLAGIVAKETRNSLSLDGFALSPHIGLNVFLLECLALSVRVEWMIPFWSEVCNEFTISYTYESEEERCADVEDADSSFADLENGAVSDTSELPQFINLEIDLVFSF